MKPPIELNEKHQQALRDNPEFTKEQLLYLEAILRLPCCHITGTHDPTHWENGGRICNSQRRKAFDRAIKHLSIDPPIVSNAGCHWCQEYYPEKEKEVEPLLWYSEGVEL